jgi:hypothetical protein
MKKLLFLLLLFTGCGGKPAPPAPVAAPPDERPAIERQTSELRGLQFLRPVNYRLLARSDLRAFLTQKIHEQYTAQELRDYGRALAALGAVPPGTDILAVMLSLYDEQVGAFYLPEERALYTFKDMTWSGALDRMLLAHELTHALQDQNYDLNQWPLKVKDNDDLALACAALLEGDATVLMTRYYTQHADRSRMMEDIGAMLGQNTAKLRDAPAFLRESLLFPYTQGQQFVAALGDREVAAAFQHPPVSTKQVLHPELYRQGQGAGLKVTPPAVAGKDWRRIADNVLGEFGIKTLLQEQAGAFQAQQAAAGWNGDRYQAYERGPNEAVGVVWATTWDTEEDAKEFAEAYTGFAAAKKLPVTLRREGVSVVVLVGDIR